MKILSTTVSLFLMLALSIPLYAQDYHVNFTNQPKWKKILKQAKKENKPIFVDAYTTWCGPCKIMDKEVFTDEKVANYFNDHFINVKMDMEKQEGNQLKLDWEVKAFPTLLFFDIDGNIMHRVVGAYKADEFLMYSEMALDEDKMALNLQKRYDAGERGSEFMYNYLVSLRLGYHLEMENEAATAYLSKLSDSQLLVKGNWPIIRDFLKDPSSKQFQFLLTNIEELKKINDTNEVMDKLYNTIDKQILSWTYWYGKEPFESEKEEKLIAFLQESNYKEAPVLLGKLLANKYKRLEDKDQYLETVDHLIKFNLVKNSSEIVYYANRIVSAYDNQAAWAKALYWVKIAEGKENKIEHKAAILEVKSKLLDKLGNKTGAELAALASKKADKEAEDAGKKIHAIPMIKMGGATPEND